MLKHRGFSLTELLVAMAIGSIISVALGMVFVQTTKAKNEMSRFGEQVENGRFAMDYLTQEVSLAGFWGALEVGSLASPSALPDPCATDANSLMADLPIHVQGYDGASSLGCISNYKTGGDVLVTRRASTCAVGASGCEATQTSGAEYFQASYCTPPATRLDGTSGVVAQGGELGADAASAASNWYRVSSDSATLSLHKIDCGNTTLTGAPNFSDRRRYIVRIFYLATEGESGDSIPSLKMAELSGSAWTVTTVASGIEQFQVEYGLDTSGDGLGDSYTAAPSSLTDWRNVVSAKIYVLSRSTTASPDYRDTKTYVLGTKVDGTANSFGPFNDGYRRNVFVQDIKLVSPASIRGG